jgi:hypothetical protein
MFQSFDPTWPSPFDHRLGTPYIPAIRFAREADFVARCLSRIAGSLLTSQFAIAFQASIHIGFLRSTAA